MVPILQARIIGPASSPAQLLHARSERVGATSLEYPLDPCSSSTTFKRTLAINDQGKEEEIAWFGSCVVWSIGSEIIRRWTFNDRGHSTPETVLWAGFVYFPIQGGDHRSSVPGASHRTDLGGSNGSKRAKTFGPFHEDRQRSTWSASPSSTTILIDQSESTSRTVLICLQSRAIVYYPSGDQHTFHLPFAVDTAFPLPSGKGGIIFQRKLEKREIQSEPLNKPFLKGLDTGHMSVLEDIDRLDHIGLDLLPRLYSLQSPFEELKPVVEALIDAGTIAGEEETIDPSTEILFIGDEYPLVVALDRLNGAFVFYARHHIPLVEKPSNPPLARHLHPSELLSTTPIVPSQALPVTTNLQGPRPSLHRTASTFSKADNRRSSNVPGLSGDTMDRSRRGPRISRGGNVEPHSHPNPGSGFLPPSTGKTGELQATLDPPSLPTAIPTHTNSLLSGSRLKRGKPRSSLAADRRQSGISANGTFARDEPEHRANVLFAAKERDLRETTMMMGLETASNGRSEIVLERLWNWWPTSPLDGLIKVFISDNLTKDMASINIHLGGSLYTFAARFDMEWRISAPSQRTCRAALPIISTRHDVFDIAALIDNQVCILSGGRESLVSIPSSVSEGRDELPQQLASSLNMTMEMDEPMGSYTSNTLSRPIKAVSDGCGTVFSISYGDGESIKVDTDFRVIDRLVRQCYEAMACLLPRNEMDRLAAKLLPSLHGASATGERTAWTVFVEVLLTELGVVSSERPDAKTIDTDPITAKLAKRVARKRGIASDKPTESQQTRPSKSTSPAAPANCLLALHLVGQDCRLAQSRVNDLDKIARLIVLLCDLIGTEDWRDYWVRLVPACVSTPRAGKLDYAVIDALGSYEQPPDIFLYLSRRLSTPLKPFPTPSNLNPHISSMGITHSCPAMSMITSVYDHLGVSLEHASDPKERLFSLQSRAGEMIRFMVSTGLDHRYINDLPVGIAMPILEMMRVAQTVPNKTWSVEMFNLIGRTDLAAQAGGAVPGHALRKANEGELDIGKIMYGVSDSGSKDAQAAPRKAFERFGTDRRVAEVALIMQTTNVRTILVQPPKNTSDSDIAAIQQSMVNTVANRTLSVLVGQGIFEYGTKTTNITDTFNIPLIELTVKVVPGKQTLQAQIATENADWPCFHNGVSTALSISPDCKGIDSSWIVFNRPQTLSPEHGGFLLGLGLTGHLRSLATYHAFPYMEPRHDFTSVGLLLGLAASFAGSEDLLLTKVLSLHTHALLPLGSMELNASAVIQSTSLVGLGLVYVGTRNLRMAEVALGEVGRREMPGVDGFKDNVEAYSFSASMAFGLIMLGRGGQMTSEVDRRLLAKLTRCMVGTASGVETHSSNRENEIDTTITAPGAILALGFMYLKTERKDVADILEIPTSAFALERVRPDILLLRTFARGLIMWDAVSPSMTWIESQIPAFIDHKNHKKSSQLELQTELAYMNILAGACLVVGLKYAGTAGETAHNSLMTCYNVLSKAAMGTSITYEGRIRRTAARQALNVVTIAWSVIMSGTGELNVLRRLRLSHGTEGLGVNYGSHMAMHMALGILFCGRGYYTLGSSNLAIAAMAISFFPRFASTPSENKAYPQAFRHLWALAVEPRCLIAKDVDTKETVYLPVKVKLREENPHDQGGGQVRIQSLISPTLIAPFEQIISIEVDSPRYWPIIYDLSNDRDRSVLVKSRTIWVKRKMGYLNYNTDAKGHRSIFVRAGAMTGWDLHYDLISPASPPTISPEEVAELVEAHSGDPALISLAKSFGGDTRLDKAMRIVLLECVSLDKKSMIPIYTSLLIPTNRSLGAIELVRQLTRLKSFYASGGLFERFYAVPHGRDRPIPMIRINFLLTLYRLYTTAEPDISQVHRYFDQGVVEDDKMVSYLVKNNVPLLTLIRLFKDKMGEMGDRAISSHRLRETAHTYSKALWGAYDLVPFESGPGERWKMESVEDALDVWMGEDDD